MDNRTLAGTPNDTTTSLRARPSNSALMNEDATPPQRLSELNDQRHDRYDEPMNKQRSVDSMYERYLRHYELNEATMN